VSIPAVTIWAALVAGASLLLLIAIDHRKPARRRKIASRGGVGVKRAPVTRTVEHLPTRPYKRTPMWKRLLSLGGLGLMGLVLGALLAIALATVVVGFFLLIEGATK
jgi:hypothetical protein